MGIQSGYIYGNNSNDMGFGVRTTIFGPYIADNLYVWNFSWKYGVWYIG